MPTTDAGVRYSDTEREYTNDRLRRAAGDGRLSTEEAGDRIAAAAAARFRSELDALTADLPASSPAPQAHGWRAVLAAAWVQLMADTLILLGRGSVTNPRRRRILRNTLALTVALVWALLLLHGLLDGGLDHHHQLPE